jgi:lipoate---protein ligase
MKLLDLTLPSPAENLAGDEALLDWCENDAGEEVLRFWESPHPFVVVGYANKVASEVNVTACEARGIPILRRCSGGGTVVQGPGCLNYALVLRIVEAGPTHSIRAANQFIMERNRAALARAASDFRLQPSDFRVQGHTDLTLDGLKFSGNAQRRQRHFLLFHGTLLLDFDLALVGELLRLPSLQPDYRNRRSHEDFLTCLRLSRDQIRAALARAWQVDAPLPGIPRFRTASLVAAKYSRAEWNLKY